MLSVSTQLAREDSLLAFERLLRSITFADEIIIYNMERSDPEFFALARRFKARVIKIKTPLIVEFIRARQIKEAQYDWVLILDSDEVVTTKLRYEISNLTSLKPKTYALKRKNFSLGYSMSHGGFGDDFVPRLFHKSLFLDWPRDIHSLPLVKGTISQTTSYLEHHKDESLEQMVEKTNRYSAVESKQFYDGGLRVTSPFTIIRKWWMETFRRGILKMGLLDGKIGIIQSIYQGFSVFTSYAKLYEMNIKIPESY